MFDALNRVSVFTYPDSTTTLTYDAGDRILAVSHTAATGPLARSYDGLDNILNFDPNAQIVRITP